MYHRCDRICEGRVAHQLLDHGYRLRGLARSPEKATSLKQGDADFVSGALTAKATIRRAVEGVDGVFDQAPGDELGGDLTQMRRVNVECVRHLTDAAQAACVLRLTEGRVDPVYSLHDHDRSTLKRTATLVAPLFNAVSGAYLTYTGLRALRAQSSTSGSDPHSS